MKKLLMMAAIVALSSSVWADNSWTATKWSICITQVDYYLKSKYPNYTTDQRQVYAENILKSAKAYLVQTDGFTESGEIKISSDAQAKIANYIEKGGARPSMIVDEREGGDVTIKSLSVLPDDGGKVIAPFDPLGTYSYSTTKGTSDGTVNNLATIIVFTDQKSYLLAAMTANTAQQISAEINLSVTPPTPVPEPTSGLLMLLGVAGLALKRKRA